MRYCTMALAAAALCASAPALAEMAQPWTAEDGSTSGGSSTYAVDEMQSRSTTPFVARGDEIAIACAPLNSATANDVRVVMQFAPTLGDLETGFKKLLATDETVDRGTVHVRIPQLAELANHTMHVEVYVLGQDGGQQSCDAGSVRVV